VNTGKVIVADCSTGQAIIQLDKRGQNAIVLSAGGNHLIASGEISAALADFGPGDALLEQNEITRTEDIMRAAKAHGLLVYLNPSPYDEKIAALPLDLVDLFFVNEIEGAALAALSVNARPEDILDALTHRFPQAEIVFTVGAGGAWYGRGSGPNAIRAHGDIIDLPVADTTGAGDTFTGYFIAARARGCSVEDALTLACKASCIAVSRPGAMQSMPFAGEVFPP
jgi:ribokinase